MLGILQPLVTMDYEDLYDMVSSLPAGAISQETLEEKTYEPMKGIIEEELSAYIVDKGEQLGASCSAQVVCAPGNWHSLWKKSWLKPKRRAPACAGAAPFFCSVKRRYPFSFNHSIAVLANTAAPRYSTLSSKVTRGLCCG